MYNHYTAPAGDRETLLLLSLLISYDSFRNKLETFEIRLIITYYKTFNENHCSNDLLSYMVTCGVSVKIAVLYNVAVGSKIRHLDFKGDAIT